MPASSRYRALTAMINRRGGQWWANAIRRAATVLVVEIGGKVAGYATIGRNRARELQQQGEIYELYLRPEYQGIGLGSRLFAAARERLTSPWAEGHGGLGAGRERQRPRLLRRRRRPRRRRRRRGVRPEGDLNKVAFVWD